MATKRQIETLVEAAEDVLLHLSYMRLESKPEWEVLEAALKPFRPFCQSCGAIAQPPMHHNSVPYFCDLPR